MNHSEDFLRMANAAKSRIKEIQPSEVGAHQADGVLLLDVRDKEEFEQGHIDGATNLSRGHLEMRIHEIAPEKDTPIVCYCAGGNRSALAVDTLQQMGYTNVISVCGGLKAYREENA